jgi:hypothetical protein
MQNLFIISAHQDDFQQRINAAVIRALSRITTRVMNFYGYRHLLVPRDSSAYFSPNCSITSGKYAVLDGILGCFALAGLRLRAFGFGTVRAASLGLFGELTRMIELPAKDALSLGVATDAAFAPRYLQSILAVVIRFACSQQRFFLQDLHLLAQRASLAFCQFCQLQLQFRR